LAYTLSQRHKSRFKKNVGSSQVSREAAKYNLKNICLSFCLLEMSCSDSYIANLITTESKLAILIKFEFVNEHT
jgi:hypothetical protein